MCFRASGGVTKFPSALLTSLPIKKHAGTAPERTAGLVPRARWRGGFTTSKRTSRLCAASSSPVGAFKPHSSTSHARWQGGWSACCCGTGLLLLRDRGTPASCRLMSRASTGSATTCLSPHAWCAPRPGTRRCCWCNKNTLTKSGGQRRTGGFIPLFFSFAFKFFSFFFFFVYHVHPFAVMLTSTSNVFKICMSCHWRFMACTFSKPHPA